MKTGITAFIDILGFSEKVLNASSESDFNLIIKNLKIVQQEFDCQGETGLLSTTMIITKRKYWHFQTASL
jgi:hypothetical protein